MYGVRRRSSLHKLDAKRDGHIIAHKNTPCLQHSVPGQAEIFAVDLRSGREPQARIAPWIFGGRRRSFHAEYHTSSDPANSQVSCDSKVSVASASDSRRLERQLRKLLRVKEVLAFQVRISLGVARVDGGHFDGSLDTRVSGIALVQGQHAA